MPPRQGKGHETTLNSPEFPKTEKKKLWEQTSRTTVWELSWASGYEDNSKCFVDEKGLVTAGVCKNLNTSGRPPEGAI